MSPPPIGICAALIADGSFREDLFYRLDVLRLHTPALAEHRADIPALAEHLLSRSAADLNLPRAVLDDDAAERLSNGPWPGNVRQLDNVLRRALVQCRQGRITADDLDIEEDETGQEAVVPATPMVPSPPSPRSRPNTSARPWPAANGTRAPPPVCWGYFRTDDPAKDSRLRFAAGLTVLRHPIVALPTEE